MVCTALAYRFVKHYDEDENSKSLLVYASTPNLPTNDDDADNLKGTGSTITKGQQSRFA